MILKNGNGSEIWSKKGWINNNRIFVYLLVLLSLMAVFCYSMGTVSANPSMIYVNNETGNDTWDGEAATWNGTSGPKLSVKNATGAVLDGGTVNLADGVYKGPSNMDIYVDKNMTIRGESSASTSMYGQFCKIFTVAGGNTVTISNLTLKGGYGNYGGAIANAANLSLINCTLEGNIAYYDGGAIYSYAESYANYLNVTNCNFIGNSASEGGAIYTSGLVILTVNNCNFISNSAYGGGAIASNSNLNINECTFISNTADYGGAIRNVGSNMIGVVSNSTFISNTADTWGGAICNSGGPTTLITFTVTNSTFTSNTADRGGAILNNYGSDLTITGSNFMGNNAGSTGGAICNLEGNSTVYFCRIIGNAPEDLCRLGGSVDADYNWWGSNAGPTGRVMGLTISKWLVLNVTASQSAIPVTGTSTVIVDLTHDNTGTYHNPVYGHVPNGILVTFNASLGSVNPGSAGTINGIATAVFTAGSNSGMAKVNATVDGVNTSTQITVLGTDIYVSTTGNDTNGDGSELNPYQSISKGIMMVCSGGNVHIANGLYAGLTNVNITIDKNMQILGQNSASTIINAEHIGQVFIINSWCTVTISNLTFTNGNATDGGAIQNKGTLTINNCNFTSNVANMGGVIDNKWKLTVNNCSFTGNLANYGGAIYNEYTSSLAVNGSTFTGNTAVYGGGAITNVGTLTVHFCKIIGNTPQDLYNFSGSVDANHNWWGSNANPSGKVYGLTISNWIVLTVTALPTYVSPFCTSTVTADLTHDNSGTYYNPALGHIPDGIQITFATNLGSLNPTNSTIINGTQNTIFTAGSTSGTANVNTTVDNQTVNTYITIGRFDVYVSISGNDTTGDGSQGNPYQSISKGVLEISTNGRVHVGVGTYSGPLNRGVNIGKNGINIFRDLWQGSGDVVIDADGYGNIFTVNAIVKMENLTFIEGASDIGGAILNWGTLSLLNCTFTDNDADTGGAVMNYGELDVFNCTFANNIATNGGAIYCEVYEGDPLTRIFFSNFTGNTAHNGNGGAIYFNSYVMDVRNSCFELNVANDCGGAVYNSYGSLILRNSSFISNSAGNDGGAIYNNDRVLVNQSNFTGNAADVFGGAIYNLGVMSVLSNNFVENTASEGGAVYTVTNAEIHFNRVVGNIGKSEVCSEDDLDPANNWWGSNEGPEGKVSGKVEVSSWLQLRTHANPTQIPLGGHSVVHVDLNWNSLDENIHDLGHVQDGIPIDFSTNRGFVYSPAFTEEGEAATIFNATELGLATVMVGLDDEQQTIQINMGREDVYVSTTGNDTTGNGSELYPYRTISKGISEVNPNGRVHIANGTYCGDANKYIAIIKNLSIIGQSQTGTIIDAEHQYNIFIILNPFNVLIQNLTFINGNSTVGGAILNSGNLTIIKCSFNNNTANIAGGYGGAIFNDNKLTITDSHFENNRADIFSLSEGGAIYNTNTAILNNSTFIGNRAYAGGAIYNSEYAVFNIGNSTFDNNGAVGTFCYGGAIYNAGNLTFTNSYFNRNGASGCGGAILTRGNCTILGSIFTENSADDGGAIYESNGYLSVIDSLFSYNHANLGTGNGGAIYGLHDRNLNVSGNIFVYNMAGYGGAIYNCYGALTVMSNTFLENQAYGNGYIGSAIYTTDHYTYNPPPQISFNTIYPTVYAGYQIYCDVVVPADANNNWWGTNFEGTDPVTAGRVNSNVNTSKWIVLNLTANPTSVLLGGSSTVIADLTHNNLGEDTSSLGFVPTGGVPVLFVTDSRGNLTITETLFNSINQAGTVFNGLALGSSVVNATFGYQTVSTSVNITEKFVLNNRTHASFSTIQDAINDAGTLNGDIITVSGASFLENIYIWKQLSIIAQGVVNVQPANTGLPVFRLLSGGSGSTIQGFIISGGYFGIYFDDASNCNINNNTIQGNQEGISIQGNSDNNTIQNNTIKNNNWNGVIISGTLSSQNQIINNTEISGNNEGISLSNTQNNLVSGNIISGNIWAGIWLYNSTQNTINMNNVAQNQEGVVLESYSSSNNVTGNTIRNNTWNGILIPDATCNNNNISGNTPISGNNVGIKLYYAVGNTVQENNATGNGWAGIWLYNASQNIIGNMNTVSNNQEGIVLQNYSNNNNVTGNIVRDNTWNGILIPDATSTNNQITNNTEISGNNVGIDMFYGTGNTIRANTATWNRWAGIWLYNAPNNTIENGNTIYNNPEGIFIENSQNIPVTGNNITSNLRNGIYISNSSHIEVTSNGNISGNQVGVGLAASSSHCTINTNNINGNTWIGVWVNNAHDSTISGNNISNTSAEGILIENNAYNITVSNNTVKNNTLHGIIIIGANNNTITNNTEISGNNIGILLSNANGNNVTSNLVTNSGWMGICILDTSLNSQILSNNITTNPIGIRIDTDSSTNVVHNNSIVNSSQWQLTYAGTINTLDATNNWWGSNDDPGTHIQGRVNYTPWTTH